MIIYYGIYILITFFSTLVLVDLYNVSFSFNFFVFSFAFILLLRFFRIPIRHVYFLTFCPVVTITLVYYDPLSVPYAAFFAILIGDYVIRKQSIKSALFGALAYLASGLFVGLIKFLPISKNYLPLFYFIIASILSPSFFYLPYIFMKHLSLKNNLYILSVEYSFMFFFTTLFYYFIEYGKVYDLGNIIIISILGVIGFITTLYALKSDKLELLHRIENAVAASISLDYSFEKLFRILKMYFPVDEFKVIIEKGSDFYIIFSNDKEFYNRKIEGDKVIDEIFKNKKIYKPKVFKSLSFLSNNTSSFFAHILFLKSMKGFVIFESFKAYSFSEDDIDRFCSIVPFISRIINTFINIQELIEFSKEIDKSSIKFRDFGFDTRNISDKIKLSVNDVYTGFSKIREKLHKEFETLENIGKMIEDTIGEISGIKDDIKNLKSSVKELLKPVDRMRVALEDFEKRIRFLEEKIEENVSLIERIQGFTDFMRDYASKTRLLSLNAAIEATRLGEKARGFSIIAEEIGDLSQSVEDVVKKITSEFESVYEFFQDIRNKMSEYNTLINEKKKDIEPFIEKERVILDKILEIMPYFENIPEKLGKSLREFSEVVVKLGENIEETEKGTKRIEEIVKNVEKMEKNVKNFLDSLKILEEYKNKVIEVERMLRKYEG